MKNLTINTEFAKLKISTVAASRKNTDGSYTIYLNPSYNDERLREAYEHEVRHIAEGHHDLEDVAEIENEVRGKTKYLLNLQVSIVAPDFTKLMQEYEEKLQAKKDVDKWIRGLERQEWKPRRRRPERTPDWVKETRRKIGLTK